MLNQPTPSRTAPALRLRGIVLGKCINPNAFLNALGSSLASVTLGIELSAIYAENNTVSVAPISRA